MINSSTLIATVNIGILIVFALYMWSGYRQGFLWKLISIFSFLLIGIIAWWLSTPLSTLLHLYPKNSVPFAGTMIEGMMYHSLNRILLFIILFILLKVVVLIIKPVVKLIGKLPVVSFFNHLCGCLLGGLQAALVLVIVAMVLRLPFVANGNEIVEESLLKYSDGISETLFSYAKEPMSWLALFQDHLDHSKPLDEKQITQVREWLLNQDIEKEQVEAFIATLRRE